MIYGKLVAMKAPFQKNLMMYCILLDGEKFVSLGIY